MAKRKKVILVEVPDELISAGVKMANVLYNLAQIGEIAPANRTLAKTAQQDWDAKLRTFRTELELRGMR